MSMASPATLGDPAGYKKALIDWLLSVGTCESMYHSTSTVLDDLAERGVDYDASDTPQFQLTCINDGGTFAEASYAKTLSATIVPNGKRNSRDEFAFHVDPDEMHDLMLGFVIQGVVRAADTGEDGWRTRNERRRRALEERIAAHDANKGKARA